MPTGGTPKMSASAEPIPPAMKPRAGPKKIPASRTMLSPRFMYPVVCGMGTLTIMVATATSAMKSASRAICLTFIAASRDDTWKVSSPDP